MTYDDDFCQIEMTGGTKRFKCKALGYAWPPPTTIDWQGFSFDQVSCSEVTDDQRKTMTHVCRGALYKPQAVADAA
jgi:hypothetical protein